jgi:hypothetical protein
MAIDRSSDDLLREGLQQHLGHNVALHEYMDGSVNVECGDCQEVLICVDSPEAEHTQLKLFLNVACKVNVDLPESEARSLLPQIVSDIVNQMVEAGGDVLSVDRGDYIEEVDYRYVMGKLGYLS